jgi:hypothetical protein
MSARVASPPPAAGGVGRRPETPGSPHAAVLVKPPPPSLTPREQCEGDWEFWCELMDVMLNGGKMPARAKARGGAHACIMFREWAR